MSRRLGLRFQGKPVEARYERRGTRVRIERAHRTIEAEVRRDGEDVEVILEGEGNRCALAAGPKGIWVAHRGRTTFLEYETSEGSRRGTGQDEIRAPMTGRVVQVAASAGQSVREGDLLVTIEAMKMEFKLAAPEEGRVAEVRCAEGDRVELGDLLVLLEPAS